VRAKIGLKTVAAMLPNSIIWDTEVHGLNVRRQFSDVVTYSIVYRTLDGVQRWQRIGRHGVWTPDLARKQARSVLMARDLGKDPSADRVSRALLTSRTMTSSIRPICQLLRLNRSSLIFKRRNAWLRNHEQHKWRRT
jgi:hypothetical protein